MANRIPQQPPLGLAIQAVHLRKYFPDAGTTIERSCLRWIADLNPTNLSCTYRVELQYKLRKNPKVWVLSPDLRLPEQKSQVHVYSEGHLCLFFPGEWNGRMILVETIVPWISEWLIHYEVWQVTGTWQGGGIHIGGKSDTDENAA